MITFFRNRRKNLINVGKTYKYVKYAIGEILLVVIGILIALQINNWNEKVKNNHEEIIILKSLRKEFEENQTLLNTTVERHSKCLELLKELNSIISPEPPEIANAMLDSLMFGLTWIPKYSPNDGVINSIIASAKISLIENDELSSMLSSLNSKLNSYNTGIERNEINVYDLILPYIKDKYSYKGTLKLFTHLKEDSGFEYSKNDLLADIGFESLVANRLVDASDLLEFAIKLNDHQTKILLLIDSELKH